MIRRLRKIAPIVAIFFVLSVSSATPSLAQVIANPNQIRGELRFSNTNPEIVALIGNKTLLGLSALSISAESIGLTPPLMSKNYSAAISGQISTTYSLNVDSSLQGIPYKMGFRTTFGNIPFTSSLPLLRGSTVPVFPEPAEDVIFNDTHCLSALQVDFVDSQGAPLTVSGATITAFPYSGYVKPNAAFDGLTSQATARAGSSSIYTLFDGTGITYRAFTDLQLGTDVFSDKMAHRCVYYVQATCDQLTKVVCQVPTHDSLGSISGVLGVQGETLLDSNDKYQGSVLHAWNGPFANERKAKLTRPANGTFFLGNLVPSAADLGKTYTFSAHIALRDWTRRILFRAPYFAYNYSNGVEVKAAQTTSLANLLNFQPGYVGGTVSFTGPGSNRGGNCLAGLSKPLPDQDTNGDGLVDAFYLFTPFHRSVGISKRAAGATSSTYGGSAEAVIDAQTDLVNGKLTATYETLLANYGAEPSLWSTAQMQFVFAPPFTAANVTNRVYGINNFEITNRNFLETLVRPGDRVQQNHDYCMSELTVDFHSNAGTFYGPQLLGDGAFTGTDYKGAAADYLVKIYQGDGAPGYQQEAKTSGYVRLCLPEGNYTFLPKIRLNSTSTTQLQTMKMKLGCNQIVNVHTDLRIALNPYSPNTCAQSQVLSGLVEGTSSIAKIEYSLNGGPQTNICTNCGSNPTFTFNATLQYGDNYFIVQASDVNGKQTSIKGLLKYAPAPLSISGCVDITKQAAPGTNGSNVPFSVVSGGGCSAGPVICSHESNSFFPIGTSNVTCGVSDSAGSNAECTFRVDINATVQTNTPTPLPTLTSTASPTRTATRTSTATASATFTATATATFTVVPTATSSPTPSLVPTLPPTAAPSSTPTSTHTATHTPTSTATNTPTNTATTTPSPTNTAVKTPLVLLTPQPTETATALPSSTPTKEPSPTATPPAQCATENIRNSLSCEVGSPIMHWSPNHKFEDVGHSVTATSRCEGNSEFEVAAPTQAGTTVWSDEPEVPEKGDGSGMTAPDAQINGEAVSVRSERRGTEDGRVYLIISEATGANQENVHACCAVVVPHSKSAASIAAVNSQAAAAQAHCRATGSAPHGFFKHGQAASLQAKGNEGPKASQETKTRTPAKDKKPGKGPKIKNAQKTTRKF